MYDVERQEWDEPELRGRRPSARSRHTATFVRWFRDDTQVDEDRIYVYGGVGASTEVVHYVDIARRTWVEPRTVGERPLPLLGHTAVHLNGSLWVFGGRDARRNYNGLWRLDTISHEWLRPAPTGMLPPPASKHVMCTAGATSRTRMVTFLHSAHDLQSSKTSVAFAGVEYCRLWSSITT